MKDYGLFDSARIKHLELIQSVIGRLGGNGFLVKGSAVTIAAAFVGFAVERGSPLLAAIGAMTTFAFWGLDGYFLQCERLFRELYRRVAEHDPSIPAFFMGATSSSFKRSTSRHAGYWNAFFSSSLGYFFGPIIAACGLAAVVLAG